MTPPALTAPTAAAADIAPTGAPAKKCCGQLHHKYRRPAFGTLRQHLWHSEPLWLDAQPRTGRVPASNQIHAAIRPVLPSAAASRRWEKKRALSVTVHQSALPSLP